MAIQSKDLITIFKSYSRSNPLPIDSTMVQESVEAATSYASAGNAYAGQILSVLDTNSNTYKIYILQPGDDGYTLTEFKSGSSEPAFEYVKVVSELPGSGMVQGCLYINTTDKTGSIYDGSEFVQVFKDATNDLETVNSTLETMQETIATLAPLNNPTFTGKVTLPGNPTGDLEAAPKQYVDQMIANLVNCAPGVVTTSAGLPQEGYKAGQTWRVGEAGTYAGQTCEAGDLIICIANYADSYKDADFIVIQANIDGAVTSSADVATDLNIVVFDGTTGKIIKDSNVGIASLQDAIAKAHEHTNKSVLDTYNKNQTDLLAEASNTAKTYTDSQVQTLQTSIDAKANSADVYTKTDVDGKVGTLQTAIDGKINADDMHTYVDGAVDAIQGETEKTIKDLEDKFGEIPDGTTVKQYVDNAVGSGSGDVADLIAQAKAEAIQAAKEYTDQQVAIKTF